MLAGHGAELSTSREDDVRRRRRDRCGRIGAAGRGTTTARHSKRARRPLGGARRQGRTGSGRRRRVGSGAAAETGCGGETTRDAGRADGAAGLGKPARVIGKVWDFDFVLLV